MGDDMTDKGKGRGCKNLLGQRVVSFSYPEVKFYCEQMVTIDNACSC